jgi:hypothetical protein
MYIYAYLICVLLLSNIVKICAMDPKKLWHAATYLHAPWPLLVQQIRFTRTENAPLPKQITKLDNVVQPAKLQRSNAAVRKENHD